MRREKACLSFHYPVKYQGKEGVSTVFLKFTKQFGKPICAALYAVFAYLAVKKNPLPLLTLLLLHGFEYLHVGREIAEKKRIGKVAGLLLCLCFGFTWWLPLRDE